MKIAVVGLRHAHITDLIARVREHEECELVAICEEDAETRGQAEITYSGIPLYDSYETLLTEVPCDAIAIGDYYTKRGSLAIAALRHGKHVVADKPLCTSLSELDEIERLAKTNGLAVGCMLDLRDIPVFRALRKLIQSGEMGRIHAVSFGGQHSLAYGTRAAWYFEPGRHGGTITDIGIHAFDLVPLLTGRRIATINAARNWNALLPEMPWLKDAAQVMLTLEDGCGVLGDVSYLMPENPDAENHIYWRITVWGEQGVAETTALSNEVYFARNKESAPYPVPVEAGPSGTYLESFLSEIAGKPLELDTAAVIRSMRATLMAQQAADEGLTNVAVI